jgi:hypothetical protein
MLLSGCAKLRHMDQLLTLKGLADEQAQLKKYTEGQDKKFESLLAEMEAGTLDRYATKKKILRAFGDPVYSRAVLKDGRALESVLYRRPTNFFGAEKIYLYFDADGALVQSEHVEGTDEQIK